MWVRGGHWTQEEHWGAEQLGMMRAGAPLGSVVWSEVGDHFLFPTGSPLSLFL